MRNLLLAAAIVVSPSAVFAQTTHAYVNGAGGFATTVDGTSGDLVGEAGVRIAPNVFVFGDVGRFHNLQPSSLQSDVDNATQTLSTLGVDVTATARVPAWYSAGGLRVQVPTRRRVTPYVFGSIGAARLTPRATFNYNSGPLGDTTPTAGDDVTSQIVASGDFMQPPSSTALMLSGGGGIEAPIARRLVVDASYRLSRVNANTPLHAQGLTFGIGYRF